MNLPLYVANEGQKLAKTNFWESEYNAKGLFYLTWNAGAARLLVPSGHRSMISEMKTGKLVVITRGLYQGKEGIELLFDDDSDSPFHLILSAEQCDRRIEGEDEARPFIVYSEDGEEWQCTVHCRVSDTLPHLEPWK